MTLLLLAAPAASAQTPAPGANGVPVGPDPAMTTATYGDWVLRCQSTTAASGPARICEVLQTMQLQGQTQPLAQVAFGKQQGTTDLHLVVALVVNVSFPSRVILTLGDKDAKPFAIDWKRCIPDACFADAIASADQIARWRPATVPGRITFKDAAGRDVNLPLSFRGLAPALDAWSKMP